jgi:hypothetical protein
MSELERRFRKRSWQENIKTTELYHLQKLSDTNYSWSARDTAKSLGYSVGAVSENLRLSMAMRIYPEIGEFKSRSDALEWLTIRGKCRIYLCREWTRAEISELISILTEELGVSEI